MDIENLRKIIVAEQENATAAYFEICQRIAENAKENSTDIGDVVDAKIQEAIADFCDFIIDTIDERVR